MATDADKPTRNQYRTSPRHQLDDRRLLLRGGPLDGATWVGVIAVGQRVFCGPGDWAADGIYLVTAEVHVDADGVPANIAVPAFAAG